ncbi:hypothetical protein BDK51DRAFT_44207 [Blyttiomyces helicus]|uniref:Uncharacterized protein n=1 Tax=Blyttiomyces helicus TaxID=388810 RepID=A0A4P9W9E1_9FUNG|nr:hypothetical protein BDK51DRAFT_44207 [Blyttiomyces helicus]|eukprot:RKO88782.1 hypothetical protein BDK51DRAFT_44207 [Blyttiomyces helicus]
MTAFSIASARIVRTRLVEPFAPALSNSNNDVRAKDTHVARPHASRVPVPKVKVGFLGLQGRPGPSRPRTLPTPRGLRENLALLETEAPIAYAFWTKYFGDAGTVTIPLFRVALAHSRRRHEIRIDEVTRGISTRTFRTLVHGDGPLADMFGVASKFGPTEKHGPSIFEESGPIAHDQCSASQVKAAPAAYAFWTEYFGDDMKVSLTLFRAALARSGRRYDVRFEATSMNTKIFRTLVIGSGPLADMFASAPDSGVIEVHRFASFDSTINVTRIAEINVLLAGLLTSPGMLYWTVPGFCWMILLTSVLQPIQIRAVVSCEWVRSRKCYANLDFMSLSAHQPYSTIDPKLRIETLQLLRTEYPLAYQFWTVNFGARETTSETFRATLNLVGGNLALSVPRKAFRLTSREQQFNCLTVNLFYVQPPSTMLRSWTRAFGRGWVATVIKRISLTATYWLAIPDNGFKKFESDGKSLKAASEPTDGLVGAPADADKADFVRGRADVDNADYVHPFVEPWLPITPNLPVDTALSPAKSTPSQDVPMLKMPSVRGSAYEVDFIHGGAASEARLPAAAGEIDFAR